MLYLKRSRLGLTVFFLMTTALISKAETVASPLLRQSVLRNTLASRAHLYLKDPLRGDLRNAPPSVTGDLRPTAQSLLADNQVVVNIGGPRSYPNLALVSVTVCASGTTGSQSCITIPNVELDTGSVGLRIFSRASGVDSRGNTVSPSDWQALLANVPAQAPGGSNESLVECYLYGGGEKFWGPITTGDLILGNTRSRQVPIQVVDSSFGTPVDECLNPTDPDGLTLLRTGFSGILGINPVTLDCGDANCIFGSHYDPKYYSCRGSQCQPMSSVPPELQTPNPISRMPAGFNNGYALHFPAVRSDGRSQVVGTLTLGLGTDANNTPPAGTPIDYFTEDAGGWLRFTYAGHTYESMFDTGTTLYYLPGEIAGIPMCANSGYWADWFCADPVQSVRGTLKSADLAHAASVSLNLGNGQDLYSSGGTCLNNVGLLDAQFSQSGGDLSKTFIMGMPFLYGKTIYAGMSGVTYDTHGGPFMAMEAQP